jgi:SAM-dependent methyltransferase
LTTISLKSRLGSVVRSLGLQEVLEEGRFLASRLKCSARNGSFTRNHPEVDLPGLRQIYETVGHVDLARYWALGEFAAESVVDRATLGLGRTPKQILEWGCGSGRVLRHIPRLIPGAAVFGCDYDEAAVKWASAHLSSVVTELNGLNPPLRFDDDSFDCVFALSVFTHLSLDLHGTWLHEVERILEPGGVFVFTTHGDHFRPQLGADERRVYDGGDVHVRVANREGSRVFSTFHPESAVRALLRESWEVSSYIRSADERMMGGQDVWVARRPSRPTLDARVSDGV